MSLKVDLASLSPDERELLELLAEQQDVRLLNEAFEQGDAPLSPTQERLWATGQLAGDQVWGNVPLAFRLRGSVDLVRLKRGLDTVIERHAVLRTVFPVESGKRVQRTSGVEPLTWDMLDCRDRDDAVGVATEWLGDVARRPFDLQQRPGIRAAIAMVGQDDLLVMVAVHHLVTDGWGIRVLLSEWSVAYGALDRGVDLAPLAWQYADFARWQRKWLRSSEATAQAQFWAGQLSGASSRLHLPFDRPRRGQPSFRSATVPVCLTAELSRQVKDFGQARGSTVFVTLLTALQCLLQKYTDQRDVVVGTIISARSRRETERMVGNFGNNMLVRTFFETNATFSEMVQRVRDVVLAAHANQDIPLEYLTAALGGDPDNAIEVPLFQTMFVLRDSTLVENLTFPNVTVHAVDITMGISALDLTLDLSDGEHGISGFFEFRIELFDMVTVQSMESDFVTLLERVTQEPDLVLDTWAPAFARPKGAPVRTLTSDVMSSPLTTETERIVAAIWASILGYDDFSGTDNFFDLGGTSLQAVQCLEEIRRRTGSVVQPMDLGARTLSQIAAACHHDDPSAPIDPTPARGGVLGTIQSLFRKS